HKWVTLRGPAYRQGVSRHREIGLGLLLRLWSKGVDVDIGQVCQSGDGMECRLGLGSCVANALDIDTQEKTQRRPMTSDVLQHLVPISPRRVFVREGGECVQEEVQGIRSADLLFKPSSTVRHP